MPRRRRRNQGGGENIDYLNKDAIYTSEADSNYANAFDALSNILSQQNLAYRGIDQQRERNVEATKLAGQTAANSAASRGLGSSGIYRGNERKVQEQSTNRVSDTNLAADDTSQTYGARNALAQQMGAGWSLDQAIKDKNYTELAKVFGLLGSYGASTGTAFSNAMSQSAAGAASRATSKAFDSLRRWQ